MGARTSLLLLGAVAVFTGAASADDNLGGRLVQLAREQPLESALPKDARLLREPHVIEQLLEELDGLPPDWGALRNEHGYRDDERVFALNRERDQRRSGRAIHRQRVTFLWGGLLRRYLPEKSGFAVAIEPQEIPTRWGLVQFKLYSLPLEWLAVPSADLAVTLRIRLSRGEMIVVLVAMTGRLLEDETIIYDLLDRDRRQGILMPVVRLERIDYLMPP
jgi:hypothetical protein